MEWASRPVSIKDIARLAKVSHSTVSRALRDSPLVNAKTAERIRKIAGESDYRASAVARSLVSRRTNTVGVVVSTIADPFNAEVVSGVEDAANERGYSVFLANSRADPEREVRVVNCFEERRVDGIIVTSSRVGALYMELLARMRVPVVFINNHNPGAFAHTVTIDDQAGARTAMEHLIRRGHRRIAYIGDSFGLQSNRDRLAGYRAAMEAGRLAVRDGLLAYGDARAEGGLHAMERLLAGGEQPTAVFCYNDLTALGALRAIHARGLRVPQDISVAGFDDLPVASYTQPPLTTIRQPMEQMGRRAMEILAELLTGGRTHGGGPGAIIKFQGELIVRQSTAPPATRKR